MGRKRKWKAGRKPRLEVRSNLDFAWYDGSISLLDDDSDGEKVQVRVHFTGFEDSDDEFWGLDILRSESEIRKRVRLLSHQLQDNECGKVVVGTVLCANYKSAEESKYYDALVTAVSNSIHGKRHRDEICNCSFTIQWQEGPAKENYATVKCPDISLIVPRDVDSHPVVRALLVFARDYSAISTVVSQIAEPEESAPGSQVSPQSTSTLERELSSELEITTIREREGINVEIPIFEEVHEQEGLEEENPEEVNLEQDLRDEKVEAPEAQEQDVFRGENRDFNEVHEQGTFKEEDFEIREVQAQRAYTEKPKVEEFHEEEILQMYSDEGGKRDGVNITGMGPEEEKQQEQKPEADFIELDWDEELQVQKLMDESGLEYRACDDELLDLPKPIADHLKDFQMVQDILKKEAVEIENFILSKKG